MQKAPSVQGFVRDYPQDPQEARIKTIGSLPEFRWRRFGVTDKCLKSRIEAFLRSCLFP